MNTFSEVVDAADKLSVDEQETLVEILRRRVAVSSPGDILREVRGEP